MKLYIVQSWKYFITT